MTALDTDSLRALIRPDRVHRDYYTDPNIFKLEMERIFGRSWLCLGHESQVKEPFDFMTTRLAGQPVIVTRDRDGEVHVMFNRCTHRGAVVCTAPKGSQRRFECPYHGWVFHADGKLAGTPYPRRYAPGFIEEGNFDLARPRVEIYRGFIFANLSQEGPDLAEFMGPMLGCIDHMVDRAPDGELEAPAGMFRYRWDGNWKIQLENLNDLYHPMFTHASTTAEDGTQFRRQGAEDDEAGKVKLLEEGSSLNEQWEDQLIEGFPHGHSSMQSFPVDKGNSGPVYERYKAAMEAAYGDRAEEAMRVKYHNSIFFPQWSLQYLTQHIRIMNPVSVNCTENIIIPLKLKGAPEEMWRAQVRSNNNSHAPSGMVMADDMDAWTRCQNGLKAQGSDWVIFARSLGEEKVDNTGAFTTTGTSEAHSRQQHKAWLHYMCDAA
jgi:benzoate/toluate 1,2-dioxygenase alpha subunit